VNRKNLLCLFVLIDCRIKPQASDLSFMEMVGLNQIPLARVFTKSDKVKKDVLLRSIELYDRLMLEKWEKMPSTFIASVVNRTGREEILNFIEEYVNIFRIGS
jgi:GTP-binding protein